MKYAEHARFALSRAVHSWVGYCIACGKVCRLARISRYLARAQYIVANRCKYHKGVGLCKLHRFQVGGEGTRYRGFKQWYGYKIYQNARDDTRMGRPMYFYRPTQNSERTRLSWARNWVYLVCPYAVRCAVWAQAVQCAGARRPKGRGGTGNKI